MISAHAVVSPDGLTENFGANASQGSTTGTLKPGEVRVNKEANATGTPNEYEITLTVEGRDAVNPSGATVVLVLDQSGSMKDRGKWTNAKKAADSLIDELAKIETVKLGIVTFNKTAVVRRTLKVLDNTNSSKNEAKGAYKDLAADEGTNMHDGLIKANGMLASNSQEPQIVIVLSDGVPTYSMKNNSVYGDGRENQSTTVMNEHKNAATTVANSIKGKKNTTLISIGYEITGTFFGNLATNSNYYFDANTASLQTVFAAIEQIIIKEIAMNGGVVTDPMGVFIDGTITDVSYTPGGSYSYSSSTNTITWSPVVNGKLVKDTVYQLKYKVKVDVEAPNFEGGFTPANATTTFSYKDNVGKDKTIDFKVPNVKGFFGTIQTIGYLVNEKGEYLDENGKVTTDKAKAHKVSSLAAYINTRNNENRWGYRTVEVNAPAVDSDFALFGAAKQNVTLTSNDPSQTVEFKYTPVKKTLKYTVEYHLEDEFEEYGTGKAIDVYKFLEITKLTVENLDADPNRYADRGYKFDSITPNVVNGNEVDNGATIIINYVKDETLTKPLSYRVEYYKDGTLDTISSYAVEEKVWIGNPDILSVLPYEAFTDKYGPGYKLHEIDEDDVLDGRKIGNGKAIKIYYISVELDTLEYTVEYHLDGVYYQAGNGRTIHVDKSLEQTTLTVESLDANPDRYKQLGYKFDSITPSVADGDEVDNGTTIIINYVKDETLTKTLKYRVEYYIDSNLDATEEVTETVWVGSTDDTLAVQEYDAPDKYKGYQRSHINEDAVLEGRRINNGNAIKIYYVSKQPPTDPEPKSGSYNVRYYQDEKLVSSHDIPGDVDEEGKIAVNGLDYSNDRYPNFRFDHIDPDPVPLSIVSGGAIHIYYVSKPTDPDPEPETKTLHYQVEYYKDGVKVDADTKTITTVVSVDDPDTLVVGDIDASPTRYSGYTLKSIDNSQVSEGRINSSGVIRVHYEIIKAPTPEVPTPTPEVPTPTPEAPTPTPLEETPEVVEVEEEEVPLGTTEEVEEEVEAIEEEVDVEIEEEEVPLAPASLPKTGETNNSTIIYLLLSWISAMGLFISSFVIRRKRRQYK